MLQTLITEGPLFQGSLDVYLDYKIFGNRASFLGDFPGISTDCKVLKTV